MTRMKESGIDWIGQIPEEWRVRPIKHIVETPVTDGPHETPVLFDTGIPFLSAEAVKDGVLDFNYKRGYISLKDHERFKKKISPKKDDIFIVKSGATTGNVGIVNTEEIFDIWSPLALIRCNKTLAIQKYIYFYLLSTLFKSQVEFNWSFGTQQNIGMGVIERIKVILPPVSEQQKIVEVLDKKTAQLDKVKSLLEEQIQKLKDYRASLIYETVTKGLDKTALMKDSGIDWIGQVPEGWGVKPLKYLIKFKNGYAFDSKHLTMEQTGVKVIRIGDFKSSGIDFNASLNVFTSFNSKLDFYRIRKSQILIAMSGATVGKISFVNQEPNVYSVINQRVGIIESEINKWIYYCLSTDSFMSYIQLNSNGSAQPNISSGEISDFKVAIPDDVVIQKCVKYLDNQLESINKLIQIKNQQIENINKQRQTLIYDYVTGKRRV
ncbi:restriction endonuclease subunit S [Streptococcus sp. 27098_8_23]|uniref:restriction endonuclease subunit S n=1 Tax=Streptococcus TaxID=1301 RepID=UPI00070F844F|nr:restriction endonuclease subunit S [Streptococcus oralis]